MRSIEANLVTIKEEIRCEAEASGRSPDSVKLVAVTKTIPPDRVLEAIRGGATDLGENYVQEAREKFDILRQEPVNWHFIGHLQSNKAKYVVRFFDLIHSVDRLSLARELDKRARHMGKIQKILIQVNISGEDTKSGISAGEAVALVRKIALLKNLSTLGLMTMPPYFNAPEKVRPFFRALRQLANRIRQEGIPNVQMNELSMGMTGDFKTAIEEGATLVRIGTAIFGARL